MLDIKGIIAAMVTPMDRQGQISVSSLRRLTNYLIDGGVHGLCPVGSSGEAYALTSEERRIVIETVVDETRGRVPIYAGTGAITTRETITLTKMAESAGVQAVLVLTPHFVSPTEQELLEHYTTVAKSTSLPVLLYNNPEKTGCRMSPSLVEKLSRVDNIVGIKDSSGDMTLTAEFIRRTSSDFAVLAGRDTLIYGTLCYGGRGSIASTATVAPRLVTEIYNAFVAGDFKRSLEAQFRLTPLRIAFNLGTFPVVAKEALNMLGVDVGPPRAPISQLSEEKRRELRQVLVNIGLL